MDDYARLPAPLVLRHGDVDDRVPSLDDAHSSAALWWLSSALGPQASTAAIQRPRSLTSGRPTT